jgi:pyruvate kinase
VSCRVMFTSTYRHLLAGSSLAISRSSGRSGSVLGNLCCGFSSSSSNNIETTGISLDMIHADNSTTMRNTKIVCTIGPSCWSREGVLGLIDNGMNLARLNFSHGDHETHTRTLTVLREAAKERPDAHVGVLVDIKGPGLRTGLLEPSLGGKLTLTQGDELEMGTDMTRLGSNAYLPCTYQSLPTSVKVGGKILVADGSVVLEVLECMATSVRVRVLNTATFGERKNVNLPGAVIDLPTLSPKDIKDLTEFVVPNKVDFIAASFTRRASDIRMYREVLGEAGKHVKIIAKIENQEGLANFDEILKEVGSLLL